MGGRPSSGTSRRGFGPMGRKPLFFLTSFRHKGKSRDRREFFLPLQHTQLGIITS